MNEDEIRTKITMLKHDHDIFSQSIFNLKNIYYRNNMDSYTISMFLECAATLSNKLGENLSHYRNQLAILRGD